VFQALKFYVQESDTKVINKEDVKSAAESTFTSIAKNVYPATKDILDSEEYFTSEDSKLNILLNIGNSLSLDTTNPKDVVKALSTFFKDIIAEERAFLQLIDKNIGDKVFVKTATAQELAIMKTIGNITSISLYSLDLFYFIISGADTEYSDKKLQEIKEGVPDFVNIVRSYIGRFDKHVKELDKVSKTHIDTTKHASLMDKILSRDGAMVTMPTMDGFTNNPIYHIRLWFASNQVDKYEALKEKKRILELKLLELKMASGGKHDAKLAKQIKYYEDKVSGLEYDIKDIESDIE